MNKSIFLHTSSPICGAERSGWLTCFREVRLQWCRHWQTNDRGGMMSRLWHIAPSGHGQRSRQRWCQQVMMSQWGHIFQWVMSQWPCPTKYSTTTYCKRTETLLFTVYLYWVLLWGKNPQDWVGGVKKKSPEKQAHCQTYFTGSCSMDQQSRNDYSKNIK